MKLPRSSGILLHPTSLPGKYGIGDLGEYAYQFIDFLYDTRQSIWQILPLGPIGYGYSPYQSSSSFAGNHLLVSIDKLLEAGWLNESDLPAMSEFDDFSVDYPAVMAYHSEVLDASFERFKKDAGSQAKIDFRDFCAEQAAWLDDYALFAVLSAVHDDVPYWDWPTEHALRDEKAINAFSEQYENNLFARKYRQWLFYFQWQDLKNYANSKGIQILGDVPIFVSPNSSDVWAERDVFKLKEDGSPVVVAGVPPDYFSETGQRWGNPHYRWDAMKADGYMWWKRRIKATLNVVDLVRIDHFRGFMAAWEVPAEEETAINGEWVDGPAGDFFEAMVEEFGDDLPFVAEDLGVITEDVREVRDRFEMPGMKILQFAFDEKETSSDFHPHKYPRNCVVYTGTHDNDTTLGWWMSQSEAVRDVVQAYMGPVNDSPRDLMRLASMSVADYAIFPMQDVLAYGTDTRMNIPGTSEGNWRWRFSWDAIDDWVVDMLTSMTQRYDRHPGAASSAGEET